MSEFKHYKINDGQLFFKKENQISSIKNFKSEIMQHSIDITLWTIAFALVIGFVSNLLAKKISVAPIVFFLGFGLILGESGLEWISPSSFSEHFVTFISLGISIILFEAGLTLDYANYRRIGSIVVKMMTLGVILSWMINAVAIYFIFNFDFFFSMFVSSLIIVSGPTVIMPILRKVKVTKKIFHILHWEGVLIDPVGVFLVLLSFELYIVSASNGIVVADSNVFSFFLRGGGAAFLSLFLRVLVGIGVGAVSGIITVNLLNRKLIPYELMNTFVLAVAVLTFSVSDILISESGLMSVIVAGLITGIKKNIHIDEIKKFKLEITNLFIALIFILISAGLDLSHVNKFGWRGFLVLLVVIFISRPINVFVSAYKSDLTIRERLFVSWLCPRGIIAASMATILTIYLKNELATGVEGSSAILSIAGLKENIWFIETFTFSVIITTVLFQGSTSKYVAKFLKLIQMESKNWVIIGAHDFSEQISKHLIDCGYSVTVIDNNLNRIRLYKKRNVNALYIDSLSPDIFEDTRLVGTSHVLALTDNMELNALICQHWKRIVNPDKLFRWGVEEEGGQQLEGQVVWSNLPKPSIVSNDIAEGKVNFSAVNLSEKEESVSLNEEDTEVEKEASQSSLLLEIDDGKLYFKKAGEDKKIKSQLYLIIKGYNFKLLLEPELIMIEKIPGVMPNPVPLYELIIEKLKVRHENILEANQLEKLTAKDKDQSFCLGSGVAIIHIQNSKINRHVLGLVVIKNGVEMNAYDNKVVKLGFILISPRGDTKKHLWIIGEILKMVSKSTLRKQLLAVEDVVELQDLLAEFGR